MEEMVENYHIQRCEKEQSIHVFIAVNNTSYYHQYIADNRLTTHFMEYDIDIELHCILHRLGYIQMCMFT